MRVKLNSLHDSAWDQEWLETSILLNCNGRRRPARTHGALSRLRHMRIKCGEKSQFDAFFDIVTKILSPDFITPHGYSRTFSTMKSQEIFNSMGVAVAPLADLGCPIFLYAGALLGYQRSGELIGHDDDIDIGVFLGDCSDSEVPQLWLEYKQKLANAGLLKDDEIQANKTIFKLKTDFPVAVDLFPAWTQQGRFSVFPYSFGELDLQTLFPLKSFGQDPLMLPLSPEALLEQSYGDSWRVPDPLFHLNWPKKMKIFHKLVNFNYAL